jgi:hypothetical protein
MTTSFNLVLKLLAVMRVRAEELWTSEEQKKDHYESWARALNQAHEHQAVESELQVIRNLVVVMEMQDKRESGEFHISDLAAWRSWDEAKLPAEAYLIEVCSARAGLPLTAPVHAGVKDIPLKPKALKKRIETSSEAERHFKKRAEAMRRELSKIGMPLKQGQALKLFAVTEGYKGFSALKVALAGHSPGFCPHCGAAGTLKQAGSVFCEQGKGDGKGYEAEGDGVQYHCTRCSGQFTDWAGIECALDSFDVKVYESHADWIASNASNLGTYESFEEATKVARAAFKYKPFTVRIVNKRTGNEVDF